MAALKCLACGHDNDIRDESCTSCSSSLNLRLCSACEAINANSAEHCHSCGAQFRAQAEVAERLEAPVLVDIESSGRRALPVAWALAAGRITRRSARRTAALWSLPLVTAAGLGAYYYYGTPEAAPQASGLKQVPAPQAPEMTVKTAPAPLAQARPVVETKAAPTPKTTPAAPKATPAAPKATPAVVTHTRAGVSAPPTVVSVPAPAAPAAAAPVQASAAAPVAAARRRVPVTHTRPEAAAAGAVTLEAAAGGSAPAAAPKDESPGCAPAVAALGLCTNTNK